MKQNHTAAYVVVTAAASFGLGALLSPSQPAAVAQVPDQGAQLQILIDQTKAMNAKMDRILGVLEGGKLQVSVKNADEKAGR